MKKLLLLLLLPISVFASNCPQLYNGNPIEVKGTVELCNTFFVSLYDKQNQRVILVAEHLKPNKDSVKSARLINKKVFLL